ncbi:MAG: Ni/Fe-hydrogenase cytochrome b subunit [Deltaproteobacteria bacterium]|nr:Ni/Fe-hydrogenase cytochrome b subunit [Deltaproteobacteria bacterium]
MYNPAPLKNGQNFITPFVWLLFLVMAVGYSIGIVRFFLGLQAVTNLGDAYPWGLWIAIDVTAGVALAAGGFTTAALVNIFGKKQFKPFEKSALVTAWLGYLFVSIGLFFDIGRYYNIWHPIVYWQGNSVLFEVAVCVMAYLAVLTVEFSPVILGYIYQWSSLTFIKKLSQKAVVLNKLVNKIMPAFIIAGVVLSFMHQSSLGTLLVIAPSKINPLWWSPILPVHFLLSAIMAGFPVVIFEAVLTRRAFNLKSEISLIQALAKYIPFFIAAAFTVRVGDFFYRGGFSLFDTEFKNIILWSLELIGGMLIPFFIFTSRRGLKSIPAIFTGSLLLITGVVLNRYDTFITAYSPRLSNASYIPSFGEIAITAALISTIIFLYKFIIFYFPVLNSDKKIKEKKIKPGVSKLKIAILVLIPSISLSLTFLYVNTHKGQTKKISPQKALSTVYNTEKKDESKSYKSRKFDNNLINPVPYGFSLNFESLNTPFDFYSPVYYSHKGHISFADGDCTVCHHRKKQNDTDVTGRRITFEDIKKMRIESCNNCHEFTVNQIDKIHPGLKTDCAACHHKNDPDFDSEDLTKTDLNGCSECHDGRPDIIHPQKPGLKGAFHYRCLNCHEKPEINAPVTCKSCHTSNLDKSLLKKGDPKQTFADSKNRFDVHQDIYNMKCNACHLFENTKKTRTCISCHSKSPHKYFDTIGRHLDMHAEEVDCRVCHMPNKKTGLERIGEKFKNHGVLKKEISLKCTSCHTKEEIDCSTCHESLPAIKKQ